MKKTSIFHSKKLTLTISFIKNRDLEWYNRQYEMSFFAKLIILGLCVLHAVFLSDVSSDITGVISEYSADSALSNCRSSFA